MSKLDAALRLLGYALRDLDVDPDRMVIYLDEPDFNRVQRQIERDAHLAHQTHPGTSPPHEIRYNGIRFVRRLRNPKAVA